MTTIVNLPQNKTHKKAYIIHNFKQIDDTILMIMYVDELRSWEKIFLNYEKGYWRTDQYKKYIDGKNSVNLQQQLSNIFYQHKIIKDNPEKQKTTFLSNYALMLYNACS